MEVYRNVDHPMKVLFDSCGHTRPGKTLYSVISGFGCDVCSGKAKRTRGDYEAVARLHNGFLVDMGKNTHDTSQWKCCVGHVFPRSFSSIRSSGKFCTKCRRSYGEMLCKAMLETLFLGKTFDSQSIASGGSVGGKALQLDLFNPELKLAVEHNGPQHYRPIACWGGLKQYEKQSANDSRRRKACRAAGMVLVEIREIERRTTREEFRQQIAERCQTSGVALPLDFWSVDLSDVRVGSKTADYWMKAIQRAGCIGLEPMDQAYTGAIKGHRWRCFAKRHLVKITPRRIMAGRAKGCPECHRERQRKPVLLEDGRFFQSGAQCSRELGLHRLAVSSALARGLLVHGMRVHRLTACEFDQLRKAPSVGLKLAAEKIAKPESRA